MTLTMKWSTRLLFTLALGFVAYGCAGVQKIPVDQSLWAQKQTKIGVALVAPPVATAYRVGGQGLLDLAINSAMASDLEKHLQSLQPTTFTPVLEKFEGRLKQAGFVTKHIAAPVNVKKLPERKSTDAIHFDRDISAIAAAEGVDAILLVELEAWGTIRSYYGFVPLGDPKAFIRVTGRLIAKDGRLRWQEQMPAPDAELAVSGEWDQAPTFPNVTRAIEGAERRAAAFLERSFFGGVAPAAPVASAAPSASVVPAVEDDD